MGSLIFNKILEEKIHFFKYSFKETAHSIFYDETSKRLIHPGEFGTQREYVCKDFLRAIIPMRLDFGTGFIITDPGDVSTQVDIIIYDKNNTPLIENSEKQRFYPVETVVGIVEVKSDLNKSDFKLAINKLARNKRLKEQMSTPTAIKRDRQGKFDPIGYPYDSIFSILICNKFTFDLKGQMEGIDSFYDEDIQPWQKHNLILSINDGVLIYYDVNKKSLMYPYVQGVLKNRFLAPDTNQNLHFYLASSYIFIGISSASIYFPEISDYIRDNFSGGNYFDQL